MPHEYDLQGPDIFTDPYPLYHRLRSKYPIHLDSHLGCWVVTSYSDVALALANGNLSSERARRGVALREKGWMEVSPLFKHISNLMFFTDPPKHTQIRSLMSKAFSVHMIDKWRPRIQEITNQLLDAVYNKGYMDIIQDIANPLPIKVIADMLGVPSHEQAQFKIWSDDLAYFLGNQPSLSQYVKIMHSVQSFMEYFREVVKHHRVYPKDDLVNALIHAEDRGVVLTEDELLINCVGLFAGGHETTTNLIGNGLLALLRNRNELQRLQNDPSLVVNAIEELLRYDSPVQFTGRIAKRTTEIGGKKIYEGQSVMLMLGSANRDPLKFQNPDYFDISRQDNRHLAFGHNIHYCIGAALARIEAQIAIRTILQRMPNLQLASAPLKWQENLSFHGLKNLYVTF